MLKRRFNSNISIALLLVVAAFMLYLLTLLRGVGGGDTAEFQRVAPTLGLAHSTGYPLYTMLSWLWSHIVPFGSMAWRMNAFSALAAAGTVGLSFVALRQLKIGMIGALGAASLLAVSIAFWQQATHAEIYAFATCLQISLIVALLAWRDQRIPLWLVGAIVGMMLAHHRTSILLLPFAVMFVLVQRPRWRDVGLAIVAVLLPLTLYVYVPLRAEAWQDRGQLLREYLLGSVGGQWFSLARLWDDGWRRWWDVLNRLIAPQWTWLGVGLAIWGAVRLWRKDRIVTIMLVCSYGLIVLFCAAYYVDDLDTFMLPAHVIQALLIGVALDWLSRWRWIDISVLVLLLGFNVWRNLPEIQTANSNRTELIARERMNQPLAQNSVVIGDGWSIESLRYLQTVEGIRPDLEFGFNADPNYINAQLKRGRSVYLLNAAPNLKLRHTRIAGMWQIENAPLSVSQTSTIAWNDGISLTGYDLPNDAFQAGDTILITLRWQAQQQPQANYTRFVHIVAADGTIWGQDDSPPQTGATSTWMVGAEHYDLAIPAIKPNTPAGTYRVIVGWYDASGQRLSIANSDTWELGIITVR